MVCSYDPEYTLADSPGLRSIVFADAVKSLWRWLFNECLVHVCCMVENTFAFRQTHKNSRVFFCPLGPLSRGQSASLVRVDQAL